MSESEKIAELIKETEYLKEKLNKYEEFERLSKLEMKREIENLPDTRKIKLAEDEGPIVSECDNCKFKMTNLYDYCYKIECVTCHNSNTENKNYTRVYYCFECAKKYDPYWSRDDDYLIEKCIKCDK